MTELVSRDWRPWYSQVILFALGWVMLFGSRAILGPVLGAIGAEWSLDEVQLGLVSSLFFLLYSAVQVPSGLVADRFGRKTLLVVGFVAFGLAMVMRGAAGGYSSFLAWAAICGLAQGTFFAPQFSLAMSAIPSGRHALGSALIYTGTSLGTGLGFVLASQLPGRLGLGWRAPFYAIAVPTILLGLVYALTLREGPRPASVTATGGSPATPLGGSPGRPPAAPPGAPSGTPSTHPKRRRPSWLAALSGQLPATYAMNFASLYAFFMLLSWLPYYLEFELGFPGVSSGLVSTLVPLAALPGGLISGVFSDRLRDRLAPMRLLFPVAALAMAGLALARGPLAIYALLLLYGLTGKSSIDPLMTARVSELAPVSCRATALGFLNLAGMAASVVAPLVTGFIARDMSTMMPAFYVSAGVLAAGGLVAWLSARVRTAEL